MARQGGFKSDKQRKAVFAMLATLGLGGAALAGRGSIARGVGKIKRGQARAARFERVKAKRAAKRETRKRNREIELETMRRIRAEDFGKMRRFVRGDFINPTGHPSAAKIRRARRFLGIDR